MINVSLYDINLMTFTRFAEIKVNSPSFHIIEGLMYSVCINLFLSVYVFFLCRV